MITRGATVIPKVRGGAIRYPMLVTEITEDITARNKGKSVAVCFWLGAGGAPHFIELAPDLLELYE